MEEGQNERAWTGVIWLRNTITNFWVRINSGELLEQLSDCEPFSVKFFISIILVFTSSGPMHDLYYAP
jgi:hypothetical protein